MRIGKLRLTGFKSFVEPAELLIEPGLTGVVGPNGCGKSNLLEAIRWVMGEGSPKSLRGGAMEDVIFAGTATRPPRQFAEVALFAEDEAGEHEVVRRVERGAGSAYRINGRDVRQRDVALMFADAATGAHSPALVSQGRIAAVIAAKPAERRQMLEEASGIAGLHVRRHEAELKLRATEANLTRLDELLGEMETRANALRRQARAAERYRTLSKNIRLAEARSLFARWREAATAAESARAQAVTAEQAVIDAAEAQRAAAAHAAEAIARTATARATAEAARDDAAGRRHALDALRLEQAAVARRLVDLEAQAANFARDRAREDKLATDAVAALATLDAEDKALGQALAAAERERGGHDASLIEVERQLRDAEVEAARAHARAAAEQAEVRVAQTRLEAARQLATRSEGDRARIEREAVALGEVGPLAAAVEAARDARTGAESEGTAAASRLAEAETRREQAAAARQTTEREAAVAGATLAGLESEATALAAGLARSKGQGVLAQVAVAKGYERALAAALGDDLDAPSGGGGMRGWAGAEAEGGDPVLPPGSEPLAAFVTGVPALARRLAQIGVVERDDGQPLAVGQRIVTRDGRLRRWDGFFARDVGAAAADRLVRVNRLAELEAELPAARAAASGARAALVQAGEVQAAVVAEIGEARRALAAAEDRVRAARRAEDNAAAALERHAASAAALAERRARVEGEAREAAEALAMATALLAELPDGAATRGAVSQASAAADALRTSLADVRARVAGHAEAIARDSRRQQAARAEARGWRARAGDAARRIAEMDARAADVGKVLALLADKPATLAEGLIAAEGSARDADDAARQAREGERAAENELRRREAGAAAAGEALSTAREARAGASARAEHQEARRAELSRLSGDRFQCPAAALAERIGFEAKSMATPEEETAQHDRLVAERERIGPVNLVAESELAELEETRATNAAERDELGQAVHRLRGSIGSLNREGRQRLTAAFEAVDGHFRRLFTTLFAGGEAHLALIDSDDPLEAGLEIMAQPPGKKLGSLTLLSGGEQALTAVALIFALFLTNPAPICVLDEVDAPLDDANIERFCDLLVRMTEETDTRYLIVTHNAVTMSRMHRLFGVTMIERGISRLVSVDLGRAERLITA